MIIINRRFRKQISHVCDKNPLLFKVCHDDDAAAAVTKQAKLQKIVDK